MEINQALFESAEALTFDDVLVVPAYSEILPAETDVTSQSDCRDTAEYSTALRGHGHSQ